MGENTEQDLMEIIMNIIINAGNAKSNAMNAIRAAKNFDFELAEKNLKLAQDSELLAHNAQTQLLAKESDGQKIELNLLIVHSQDHLMNCITFNELARELIDLYKTMGNKKD